MIIVTEHDLNLLLELMGIVN